MSVPSNVIPCIQNSLVNIRTSTIYDANTSLFNCALNYTNDNTKITDGSEAFVAGANDQNQYIIIGSETPRTFTHVATQGRGDADQWVTTYKIRYTLDNINWTEYGQVINANNDRNSIVAYAFNSPILARSIAIHPLTWNNHIALRFEAYCKPFPSSLVQTGIALNGVSIPSGNGGRGTEVNITFPIPFLKPPKVILSLNHIYTGQDGSQTRIEVRARNITTTGFQAVAITWERNDGKSISCFYHAIDSN